MRCLIRNIPKSAFGIFRLILFVVVLGVLLNHVPLHEAVNSFKSINVFYLLMAFIVYLLRYALMAARWHLAASAYQCGIQFRWLLLRQIEIVFLEMIIPIPDSEDGLKIIAMKNKSIGLASAVFITIFDRVMGLAVVIVLLPGTYYYFLLHSKGVDLYLAAWATSLLFMFLILLFHRQLLSILLKNIPSHKYFPSVLRFRLVDYLDRKISLRTIFISAFTTIIFVACCALAPWLLTVSIDENVLFFAVLMGMPFCFFSAILPISLQGVGLYEAALLLILQAQGMVGKNAIVIATIHLMFHFSVIIIGGIVHVSDSNRIHVSMGARKKINFVFKSHE